MSCRLRVLSGLGAKAAACFLIEAPGGRLLLDLGAVGDPASNPDLRGVGPVDAVILGHLHPDHAGGLPRAAEVGDPPIHATGLTATGLAVRGLAATGPAAGGRDGRALCPLPLRGRTEVCGVPLTTGRNGHAPGGVWLHLGLGDGLLYCGDLGFGSAVWPLDAPPAAGTVVIDASFGAAEAPAEPPVQALAAALEAVRGAGGGPLLLPAPAWGRGPELALAAHRLGAPLALDAGHRAAIAAALAVPGALLPAAVKALPGIVAAAEAAETAPARPGLVVLIDDAPARGPLAADWLARIEAGGGAIRFTGHRPPGSPAARLVQEGRAGRLPWAVHPWLAETRALLAGCGARAAMPAFCDPAEYPALAAALAPVALLTGPEIALQPPGRRRFRAACYGTLAMAARLFHPLRR